MSAKKESYLPGFNSKTADISHGGDHTMGKRKIRRPLDPKQALHVVLRSSTAHGELSMLHPRHGDHIHHITEKLSKRWGVQDADSGIIWLSRESFILDAISLTGVDI